VNATRTRRYLTPVDITERYRSIRTGRMEACAARSRDGLWLYERLDMPGTPWRLVDAASRADCGWFGSLPKARAYTASGEAARELAKLRLARVRAECAAAGITAESPDTLDPDAERLAREERWT